MVDLVLGPVLRHVSETSVTVWVETDAPCEVEIHGRTARTFTAHGHHYALVVIEGLAPATHAEYQVRLDGVQCWPEPDSAYPPSVLRTLDPDRQLRLVFGSCRHATPYAIDSKFYDPDALDSYARRMVDQTTDQWPDALLLLGDQVYADKTTEATQEFIAARRSVDEPPGTEVADFEEYTRLYLESWGDPEVRWMLSNVPSAMIFDDHDIRDDWNTSYSWRREMEATSWWSTRIIGGLASYWVYQHIGNLSPAELAADTVFSKLHDVDDAGDLLDSVAAKSDDEVDTSSAGMGVRWSYRLDYGRVRVLFIDTRCGRVLGADERSMLSDAEFSWLAEQVSGDYDHLLIASSLPWLLPWGIHHMESFNEAVSSGAWGTALAGVGEKFRRGVDLEHWASFYSSFLRLAGMLSQVARGQHGGPAPASVLVLSGDVHHGYVARAEYTMPTAAPVYQLTCSPIHNGVPTPLRLGFTVGWSRVAAGLVRPLARLAGVKRAPLRWTRLGGPYFGNILATLVLHGRVARLQIERAYRQGDGAELRPVAQVPLAWTGNNPDARSTDGAAGAGSAGAVGAIR